MAAVMATEALMRSLDFFVFVYVSFFYFVWAQRRGSSGAAHVVPDLAFLIRIEDSRATTPVRRGVEKNCTDSPV
jgi:hypothetical protein